MKTKLLLLFQCIMCISVIAGAQINGVANYNFTDGSILATDGSAIESVSSEDGMLSIEKGEGSAFKFNDGTHGGQFKNDNVFVINVSGQVTVSFTVCKYSAAGAEFIFTNEQNETLGTCRAESNGGDDGEIYSFKFNTSSQKISATLQSEGSVYIHALSVVCVPELPSLDGFAQVWDFGAEQLHTDTFINMLDVSAMNALYDPSVESGSTGNTIPDFTVGVLSWVGKPTADRLRTSNESLTRYDENVSGQTDQYTGRIYANGSVSLGEDLLPTLRYLSVELSEDDELTIVAISQNGKGMLTFVYEDDITLQSDVLETTNEATGYTFIAKKSGCYRIYDAADKMSVYRVYRQNADMAMLTGSIDNTNAASFTDGSIVQFQNSSTGKVWQTASENGTFSIELPAGYEYEISFPNNLLCGVVGEMVIDVQEEMIHDLIVEEKITHKLSGKITGLGASLQYLCLDFKNQAYPLASPDVSINFDEGTYEVDLEENVAYVLSIDGVNDFLFETDTIIVLNDAILDLSFVEKQKYTVQLTYEGITPNRLDSLEVLFTNIYEDGYSYAYSAEDTMALRSGTYTISVSGIDNYPMKLQATSNLQVIDTETSKKLQFIDISEWTFDDQEVTTSAFQGLLFSGDGAVSNQVSKGHLVCKPGAVIQVPIQPEEKLTISYYYDADITIANSEQHITTSHSTSLIEQASYLYQADTAGFIEIEIGDTVSSTYICNISTQQVLPYTETITVGVDKMYKHIQEALIAIEQMDRTEDQRVVVAIDPGNYEEMIRINTPNISFVNSSITPNTDLLNGAVDIDEDAVRITSYYGHGYNYYSMGDQCKWDSLRLKNNIDNGYFSNENSGAGTSNGSYWNATVVVNASGFIAEHIIFENSFNQYISNKEANDIVVEWDNGGKGTRPTGMGNTDVQNKSFVERAAAIAITKSGDQTILNRCRIVGRQDSFYGAKGVRVAIYKGAIMGATDFIFGGMTAVFYKSAFTMNTSDDSNDIAYITAAQQESGRGYLMYQCLINSANPGTETMSAYQSKPGYFGRPWQANTSEVIFFETLIDTTNFIDNVGESLIVPVGWNSTLGGESVNMCEYGTVEACGSDHTTMRSSWSSELTVPLLNDGTEITPFNFTKGTDDWNPIETLVSDDDVTSVTKSDHTQWVNIYSKQGAVCVDEITEPSVVSLFTIQGALVKQVHVQESTQFLLPSGTYIICVNNGSQVMTQKVFNR